MKVFEIINYDKAKKRKEKKKNCSLYRSGTNLYQMWCGLMWYLGQCWEKCHALYIKRTYG